MTRKTIRTRKHIVQKQLELRLRTWGGKRDGAGRPRSGKTYVPHTPRPKHSHSHPVHVTLRVGSKIPSLRERPFDRLAVALSRASKSWFRLVHYSVQSNHIHLIVEAADRESLSRGMQGLVIRAARAINRALRRTGAVFADHYHTHTLRGPRETRNAIAYVLHNWKKHMPGTPGIDPCSSGAWFDGWKHGPALALEPPVRAAKTWLGAAGWRRQGLIALAERPKGKLSFD